jgi:hypothetical protein
MMINMPWRMLWNSHPAVVFNRLLVRQAGMNQVAVSNDVPMASRWTQGLVHQSWPIRFLPKGRHNTTTYWMMLQLQLHRQCPIRPHATKLRELSINRLNQEGENRGLLFVPPTVVPPGALNGQVPGGGERRRRNLAK